MAGQAVQPGDLFWFQPDNPDGPEARIPHPAVVIEAGDPVVICLLTSNRQRVTMPGNVLLDAGEGNLPRMSVVEVSKVFSVPGSRLGGFIGRLSERRVEQILAGRRFVQAAYFKR